MKMAKSRSHRFSDSRKTDGKSVPGSEKTKKGRILLRTRFMWKEPFGKWGNLKTAGSFFSAESAPDNGGGGRKRKTEGAENAPPDYRVYRLSLREWISYLLQGVGACALIAYVFYRSVPVFGMLLPLSFLRPLFAAKTLGKARRDRLRLEFREGIEAIASALETGASLENAFSLAAEDMKEIYGEDGMIAGEFYRISRQLRMNRTVETLVEGFAERSGVEEIRSFAEILAISKRSQGGTAQIIAHVSGVISGRIRVKEEIENMTAEKRFEQKIMNLIPFGIVIYIDFTSPGFFQVMYTTVAGRVVMTVCLVVYAVSWMISDRILRAGQAKCA